VFIEFIVFLGFVELVEQWHVEDWILFAEGNSKNPTNPTNTTNKYAGFSRFQGLGGAISHQQKVPNSLQSKLLKA